MRKIKGMSFSGMMGAAALVVIFGILVMKIVPIYVDNYQVKQAVNSLSNVSSDRFSQDMAYNANKIRSTLINQFYIDSIEDVKNKNIVIKPMSYKQFNVMINYEAKKHIIANISILVNFKIEQEVEINAP